MHYSNLQAEKSHKMAITAVPVGGTSLKDLIEICPFHKANHHDTF
jgi:hypothetical protein